MGSALAVKSDKNKQLTGMVMPLKLPDSQGEGKFNLRIETVRHKLPRLMVNKTILRENPTPLSSPRRPLKNRNPQPPINKVSPPAMKDRDLQPNLMSPMSHLGGNQPNGPTNPFDVLLSIKRRQHQIPYPERQIVAQLSTKQIHPVGYKVSHRQMRQKLSAKLSNPSLRHPLLIMKLQKRFDFLLPIGHHHIVRITQNLSAKGGSASGGKEGPLSTLSLLPLTPNQIPISSRPPLRLIPELPITERIPLQIPLPDRLRQGLNLPHQRLGLIRCNRKPPYGPNHFEDVHSSQ